MTTFQVLSIVAYLTVLVAIIMAGIFLTVSALLRISAGLTKIETAIQDGELRVRTVNSHTFLISSHYIPEPLPRKAFTDTK